MNTEFNSLPVSPSFNTMMNTEFNSLSSSGTMMNAEFNNAIESNQMKKMIDEEIRKKLGVRYEYETSD